MTGQPLTLWLRTWRAQEWCYCPCTPCNCTNHFPTTCFSLKGKQLMRKVLSKAYCFNCFKFQSCLTLFFFYLLKNFFFFFLSFYLPSISSHFKVKYSSVGQLQSLYIFCRLFPITTVQYNKTGAIQTSFLDAEERF